MMRITEQSAIILNEIMKAPDAQHTVPDIAEATGIQAQVVRQNLVRFHAAGWFAKARDAWTGNGAPPWRFRLTSLGRKAIRAELEGWTFEDA